ncbi:MAG: ABC transporter ATP-binding protein [Oligoflexia bacterium]|nr:ABC transporter ATP-binding protein [Oligoflexia bacterium]
MAHLKINNLTKSYGANKILHGISLEVQQGEFVSFLGPSGCGKTTTLRCIAGLETPDSDSGDITVGDKTLSSQKIFVKPEDRNLGMVFQSYAVWPHMNVFENVAFPLRMKKRFNDLGHNEISKIVSDSLALVHLSGLEKRFGNELSGGQQQRVALARALAMSPQILLLDEPLSNLDVILREELRAEIQKLQRHLKMTTILVTHDQREALSLSDRIFLMNKGKIEAVGTPEELYTRPPTVFAAEFLVGGQTFNDKSGKPQSFIPRRWKHYPKPGLGSYETQVVSRLYLGSEYEYWVESSQLQGTVKFFSAEKLEPGSKVYLTYQ